MPRIRRDGKRIRGSDGGRTRNEDCCCDQPAVNPDCSGMPATWLVQIGNMPNPVNGSFRNCLTGGHYAPWSYCSTATRTYDQACRGFCDQLAADWEFPYLGQIFAPGDFVYGFLGYTWPNACVVGSCGNTPSDRTGDFHLRVTPCVDGSETEDTEVFFELDVDNVVEWAGSVVVPAGDTLLDVGPITLTDQPNTGPCVQFSYNPTTCENTATLAQSPTCVITPNG
jgi:hypothetical protein